MGNFFKNIGSRFGELEARVNAGLDKQDAKVVEAVSKAIPKGPVAVGLLLIKGAYHCAAVGAIGTMAMASTPMALTIGGLTALYLGGKKIFYKQNGYTIEEGEIIARRILREYIADTRARNLTRAEFRVEFKKGTALAYETIEDATGDAELRIRRYTFNDAPFDILEEDALTVEEQERKNPKSSKSEKKTLADVDASPAVSAARAAVKEPAGAPVGA